MTFSEFRWYGLCEKHKEKGKKHTLTPAEDELLCDIPKCKNIAVFEFTPLGETK
jgi:hypothetical protein